MTHIPPRPRDDQLFRVTTSEVAADFPHLSSSRHRPSFYEGAKIGSRAGGLAVAQFDPRQTGGIKTVAYSYDTPIGVLVTLGQADVVLVSTVKYSVTTAKHQRDLSTTQKGDFGIRVVIHLPLGLDMNAHRLFDAACETLVSEYKRLLVSAARATVHGTYNRTLADGAKDLLVDFGDTTGLDTQPYLAQCTWDHLTSRQKAKLVALRMN